MEGGHGTELLESAGGGGAMGTRSPKIGYQPIISVVTLRAEPHIRLDNKLWTVHGIWIFTKDTLLTRKVSRTSIAFHLFLRKCYIYYIHRPPLHIRLCISSFKLHICCYLACVNLVSQTTVSFFPVPALFGQLHLHWNEDHAGTHKQTQRCTDPPGSSGSATHKMRDCW